MNHPPSAIRHAHPCFRHVACAMVLVVSIAAVYALYPRFVSQIYYLKARQYHKDGYLGLAVRYYKKAALYQPRDSMIWKRLAEAQFGVAKKKMAQEAFSYTLKAKDSYLRAIQYNPLDIEIAYGLAKAESRLEQLYQHLNPKEKNNPYHPLPYFERAIHLRPNGITAHYEMARYLFRHDDTEALAHTVRSMARMYPPVYTHLKKEPLWSAPVKEAVQLGLLDAIKQDLTSESAHKAMSYMLAENKEWAQAIVYYQKALAFDEDKISEGDYINLGRLFLQNHQVNDAEINFIKGLYLSTSFGKSFENIARIYKNSHRIDDFYTFYEKTKERFVFSPELHIISARYLIDLKQYPKAQRISNGS